MEKALAQEVRELVASARALVLELAEEGVDQLARMPKSDRRPEGKPASVEGRAAPRPPRSGQTSEHPDEPELFEDERPWGESPSVDEVRAVLGECTRCPLSRGRRRIVFGEGDPDADLMFVGEGPGAEEDRQGLPIVGRAGELLTQMIEKGLGIPRSSVYICNIVKCRPPNNRNPLAEEAATCRPFLEGQIAAVRPRVIVALGKPAASLLLGVDVAITRVR